MVPNKTLVGRRIAYVKLHTTLFVPGCGQIEATLPPMGKTVSPIMTHEDAGVFVIFNTPKGEVETLVPWGTVQVATYERKK